MKPSRLALCALILLTAFDARAARPEPKATAITNVRVVDVEAGLVRPAATVVISGDRIVSVSRRPPKGARLIDGRGRYLTPGFWDMHTHHQASGAASLLLFVANGVVGTRDMGSDLTFILPLRAKIRRGEVVGPEIVAAGPILDAAPADWPWRQRVRTASDGRAAVASLKAAGVDFIKVHDQTPREAYFAIAEASKRSGLPFAGHLPNAVKVSEAAASGQASIEHLANFRVVLDCSGGTQYAADKCAPTFSALAKGRVWQTPTFAFFLTAPELLSGKLPPAAEYASPGLHELWRKNAEASALPDSAKAFLRDAGLAALAATPDMQAAGVRFLSGCDGLTPGFCMHDELEWMTKAGMTPAEALRTATTGPAEFLGRSSVQGQVRPGHRADLILLDRNPLADIRNTRSISGVVLRGAVYQGPALKEMIAKAKANFSTAPRPGRR